MTMITRKRAREFDSSVRKPLIYLVDIWWHGCSAILILRTSIDCRSSSSDTGTHYTVFTYRQSALSVDLVQMIHLDLLALTINKVPWEVSEQNEIVFWFPSLTGWGKSRMLLMHATAHKAGPMMGSFVQWKMHLLVSHKTAAALSPSPPLCAHGFQFIFIQLFLLTHFANYFLNLRASSRRQRKREQKSEL